MPIISVIMGVYNCDNNSELIESIKSILNQSFKDLELIICDDGSTDDTYERLLEISKIDSRIRIIGYKENKGLAYALNECIKVSKGICIKGIAPGAIQTPMNAADFAGNGEMAEWVANETPVKRWAQPEEVAELTLFLATPQASYIQGTIIPIDGGWLLK